MSDKELVSASVSRLVHIDPDDVVTGLEQNDELILKFICQVIALAESSELRERLLEQLGVKVTGVNNIVSVGDTVGRSAVYDENAWNDEEWV